MAKVTYFGIFQKEMMAFLTRLPEFIFDDNKSRGKFEEWLFEKGYTVYQMAQSAEYQTYVSEHMELYKTRPMISSLHMKGQHYTGLVGVKQAIVQELGLANDQQKELVANIFDTLVLNSVEKHKPFIAIEAAVATKFHKFLDETKLGGEKLEERIKRLEKCIELFKDQQASHPELAEEFNFKITTIEEYLEAMKPKVEEASSMRPS